MVGGGEICTATLSLQPVCLSTSSHILAGERLAHYPTSCSLFCLRFSGGCAGVVWQAAGCPYARHEPCWWTSSWTSKQIFLNEQECQRSNPGWSPWPPPQEKLQYCDVFPLSCCHSSEQGNYGDDKRVTTKCWINVFCEKREHLWWMLVVTLQVLTFRLQGPSIYSRNKNAIITLMDLLPPGLCHYSWETPFISSR